MNIHSARNFAAAGFLGVAILLGTAGTAMAATPAGSATQAKASTLAGAIKEEPVLAGIIVQEGPSNPIIHGG